MQLWHVIFCDSYGPGSRLAQNIDIAIIFPCLKSQVDLAISGDSLYRTPLFLETKKRQQLIEGSDKRLMIYQEVNLPGSIE
jgi:hypothetical protein